MKNLISMVDFVEEIKDYVHESHNNKSGLELIFNYATFLKQPLTLGMFVPCVDNEAFNYSIHGNQKEFEKAKEKVLFGNLKVVDKDNFYFVEWENGNYYRLLKNNCKKTVEDLLIYKGVELTESAIKQIGI